VGASSTAATCGGGQGSLRSWSSHRAEKLLCIALGRKTLAAISTTAQPHTSETPPQSGLRLFCLALLLNFASFFFVVGANTSLNAGCYCCFC